MLKKLIALALASVLLAGAGALAADGGSECSLKDFAKNGLPDTQIVFYADDFSANLLGDDELTGVLVGTLPAGGTLLLDGSPVRAGQIIAPTELGGLVFSPSEGLETASFQAAPVSRGKYSEVCGELCTVSINYARSVDRAPTACPVSAATYTDMPVGIDLAATDPEGGALTFTVVSLPKKGTLSLSDGRLVYTPASGKTGDCTFEYYVTDTAGNTSDVAEVSITVEKPGKRELYSDMTGHPDHAAAVLLASEDIWRGCTVAGELLFEPEKTVSRGEFIAAALAIGGDSGVLENASAAVSAGSGFFGAYVSAAMDCGLVNTARSGDAITRAEALTVLARLLGAESVSFTCDCAPAWAADTVCSLSALGIAPQGSALGTKLTRAEAAALLANALRIS